MKTFVVASVASTVAGHSALIGFGPEKCRQSARQPDNEKLVQNISGTDGGMTNLQGVRCVSQHMSSTSQKIENWCKDTGDFSKADRDQGFCFGTSKNTYTSDSHQGLPESTPALWGNDKDCTWTVGDDIHVALHITQQHRGTHFVDFVPQNAEQLEGLPPCPGSKDADGNVAPFTDVDKRISGFQVCYQDNVNVAQGEDLEDWQRKTIRLHPAFALLNDQEATKSSDYEMKYYDTNSSKPPTNSGSYRVEYKFKLPELKFDSSKPAVFRWVWFCGYDAQCDCTPSNATWMKDSGVTTGGQCPHDDYIASGMGEIFINCADIKQVNGSRRLTSEMYV